MRAEDRKVVLVTRPTRLDALVAQHHTLAQAKFYIEHLGADLTDYLRENDAYSTSLRIVVEALQRWGRYQLIDRSHLTNFVFAEGDIVIALGQDGLVANTLKYLDGQPVIGINPEPKRWDGVLLPFEAPQLAAILSGVANDKRNLQSVTMAEARLSDGQTLLAVNDLFIGPRTHTSALYDIEYRDGVEHQSSSGLIISTGLGSTAWLKSIVTGTLGIAAALGLRNSLEHQPQSWDVDHLTFVVREPFASRSSQTNIVFGQIERSEYLIVRSRMPETGVIFSDGIEADFLRFTAGLTAEIGVAKRQGKLVR